jgi:hypothetical protein
MHFGLSPDDKETDAVRALVLKIAEYFEPDLVGFLGDVFEAKDFSRFPPKSLDALKQRGFEELEARPITKYLDTLAEMCQRMVFIAGNHEAMPTRWAIEHHLAPSAALRFLPETILRYDGAGQPRKNFTYVPYTGSFPHYKAAPNWAWIHGWAFGENCATVHYRKAKTMSVLFGHVHREVLATFRNPFNGQVYRSYSPGTLSTLDPEYKGHDPSEWSRNVLTYFMSAENPNDWTSYPVPIRRMGDYMRAIMHDGHEIRVKIKR